MRSMKLIVALGICRSLQAMRQQKGGALRYLAKGKECFQVNHFSWKIFRGL